MVSFDIECSQDHARAGIITTPHGRIQTPAFLFCATKATLRGVPVHDIEAQILLCNTYHLMQQAEKIKELGGLHAFMGWQGPLFTDSGGYQIFSLGHGSVGQEIKGKGQKQHTRKLSKVTEQGAEFISHLDGTRHLLTPERAIDIQQRLLGVDLMCVLDECTPFHVSVSYTQSSMHLSHRWALRGLQTFQQNDTGQQGLYGIMQGGIHENLRRESGAFINENPFFGHAIGGSLGATKEQMYDIVSLSRSYLSGQRPVHLLGIGGLFDIFHGVTQGIDTFDCVLPTRLGRHGGALITPSYWRDAKEEQHKREHINLFKSCFATDAGPIDPECPCKTCQYYSRAYLHHLLKARELVALSALTLHNMVFMNRFMAAVREAVFANSLISVKKQWLPE